MSTPSQLAFAGAAVACFVAGLAAARAWSPSGVASDGAGVPVAVPDASVSQWHFPNTPPPAPPPAREAGAAFLRHLDGDPNGCVEGRKIWKETIPTAEVGGEQGSLDWLCRWALAGESEKAEMTAQPTAARFVRFLSAHDWRGLRTYVTMRYKLGTTDPQASGAFRFFDEVLRFNSPTRLDWDHVDEVIRVAGIGDGTRVGDVGAGLGFYAFRFSEVVGASGRVYAVELDDENRRFLQDVQRTEGLANLEVLPGTPTSTGLAPGSVDVLFLSSTYQAIYAATRGPERRVWIESARAAVRPGGRIVVMENVPDGELAPGVPPPRGNGLASRLVAAQLQGFGFRFLGEYRFIPQRYVLVFEV